MKTIKFFYLDEPLSLDDEQCVLESLVSWGEINDAKSTVIEYCRVPSVFSVNVAGGLGSGGGIQQSIDFFRKHLLNAGVRAIDSQLVWIMPKETGRGALFQMAFFDVTGFYPYVVQRWLPDANGVLRMGPVRMIDGHGMVGLKR